MSAKEQMRKMLDELMGSSRNGEDMRKQNTKFYDKQVCKNFLLNCCPHDFLAETRMNLGRCKRIHDPALRADFEKCRDKDKYYYDVEVS